MLMFLLGPRSKALALVTPLSRCLLHVRASPGQRQLLSVYLRVSKLRAAVTWPELVLLHYHGSS